MKRRRAINDGGRVLPGFYGGEVNSIRLSIENSIGQNGFLWSRCSSSWGPGSNLVRALVWSFTVGGGTKSWGAWKSGDLLKPRESAGGGDFKKGARGCTLAGG